MTAEPLLYVGVAEPLVEVARLWVAEVPPQEDEEEQKALLKKFPHKSLGAYGLTLHGLSALAFRTGPHVNEERVRDEVERWCGRPPKRLDKDRFDPISPLDYREVLSELRRGLDGHAIRIVLRAGLTLRILQDDLAHHRPDLVILLCHGTAEGCLLFEDGRGRADFVPGDRFLPTLRPMPTVLFLAACHSETVLNRAGQEVDQSGAALVYVRGDTPVEVATCSAFQSTFIKSLLRGETAGVAFDQALVSVGTDPSLGPLSVGPAEVPPGEKLRIDDAGREVRLEPRHAEWTDQESEPDAPPPEPVQRSMTRRRRTDRFVGRRRDNLDRGCTPPPRPGTQAGPRGGRQEGRHPHQGGGDR